jgi:hypothetical protein
VDQKNQSYTNCLQMKSEVIIQFEMEGFHNYPNPPEQVEFLKYPHRHTFMIKCGYKVTDLNREKEIFICRDIVKEYLNEAYGSPCQFENMSCEMIAKEILEFSKEDQMNWCEVWEENTGGAKVEL